MSTHVDGTDYAAGGVAVASLYLSEVFAHMIPWLFATMAVIVCDLVLGLRRAWLMGEKIRFSEACRNTMGKTVGYFAFVCMACAVNQAAGGEYGIDKWSCLLVCIVEGSSVFSNILRPKGIEVNIANLLNALFRKAADIGDAHVFERKEEDKETR